MKKKILLMLMSLLATVWCIQLQAQDEVFPKSDAIWVIHAYGYWNNNTENQFVYGLSGDTIINDLTYQRLYLLNDNTLTIDDGDVFIAGIRQENKKIYVLPAEKKDGTQLDEFLMYDFSKDVGEEVIFYTLPGDIYFFEDMHEELFQEKQTSIIQIDHINTQKIFYLSWSPTVSYV